MQQACGILIDAMVAPILPVSRVSEMRKQALVDVRRPGLYMKKALSEVIEMRDLRQLVRPLLLCYPAPCRPDDSSLPLPPLPFPHRPSGGASRGGRTSGRGRPLRRRWRTRSTGTPRGSSRSTCPRVLRTRPSCTCTGPQRRE